MLLIKRSEDQLPRLPKQPCVAPEYNNLDVKPECEPSPLSPNAAYFVCFWWRIGASHVLAQPIRFFEGISLQLPHGSRRDATKQVA